MFLDFESQHGDLLVKSFTLLWKSLKKVDGSVSHVKEGEESEICAFITCLANIIILLLFFFVAIALCCLLTKDSPSFPFSTTNSYQREMGRSIIVCE